MSNRVTPSPFKTKLKFSIKNIQMWNIFFRGKVALGLGLDVGNAFRALASI
jgi:hypothetical protein